MGKIKRSSSTRRIADLPRPHQEFITRITACTNDELLVALQSFTAWGHEKGDLYQWIDVFNKFDDILEANVKADPALSLASAPSPSAGAAFNSAVVCEVLRCTCVILENCGNKHLYSSVEHLSVLLASDQHDLVIASLRAVCALVKKSSGSSRVTAGHTDPVLNSRLFALSQGWGSKDEGLGMLACVQDNPPKEFAPADAAVHFEFFKEAEPAAASAAPPAPGAAAAPDVGNVEMTDTEAPAKDKKESGSQGQVVIDERNVASLGDGPRAIAGRLFERFGVPEALRFPLLARVRLAHAYTSLPLRRQCVRIRLLSLLAMVQAQAEPELISQLLASEPEFMPDLIEVARADAETDARVPVDIRALAVRCLAALAMDKGRHGTVLSLAGGAVHHGTIPTQLRKLAAALADGTADEDALTYGEALMGLLGQLGATASGSNALTGAGAMAALVPLLDDRSPKHHAIAGHAVRVMELFMDYSNAASSTFRDLNGIPRLLARIYFELFGTEPPASVPAPAAAAPDAAAAGPSSAAPAAADAAAAGPSSAPASAPAEAAAAESAAPAASSTPMDIAAPAPTELSVPHSRRHFVKQAMRALALALHAQSATQATAQRIRALVEAPALPAILRHLLLHSTAYGGTLFALAASLMSDLLNNDPTCLAPMLAGGVPAALLDAVKAGVAPFADALCYIPNAINAVCLNAAGLALVQDAAPLPAFLSAFARRDCARVLSGETASVLGSGYDELLRHAPALRAPGVQAVVGMLGRLAAAGGAGGEGEAAELDDPSALPDMVANAARFLETFLSNGDHARLFVDARGVEALLRLHALPRLPLAFARTPAAHALASAFRALASQQATPVARALFGALCTEVGTLHAATLARAPEPEARLDVPNWPEENLAAFLRQVSRTECAAALLQGHARGVGALVAEWTSTAGSDAFAKLLAAHTRIKREVAELTAAKEAEDAAKKREAREKKEAGAASGSAAAEASPAEPSLAEPGAEPDLAAAEPAPMEEDREAPSPAGAGPAAAAPAAGGAGGEKKGPREQALSLLLQFGSCVRALLAGLARAIAAPGRHRRDERAFAGPGGALAARSVVSLSSRAASELFGASLAALEGPDASRNARGAYLATAADELFNMLFDERNGYAGVALLEAMEASGALKRVFDSFAWLVSAAATAAAEASPPEPPAACPLPAKGKEAIYYHGRAVFRALASYAVLLDRLASPAILLSPATAQAAQLPSGYGGPPAVDPRTSLRSMQARVAKAVQPLWSRPDLLAAYPARVALAMLALMRQLVSGTDVEAEGAAGPSAAATATEREAREARERAAAQQAAARAAMEEAAVSQLVEMGFPRGRSARAVRAVGGPSVELAMEWLLTNPDDGPDDEPAPAAAAAAPAAAAAAPPEASMEGSSEEDELAAALALSLGQAPPPRPDEAAQAAERAREEEERERKRKAEEEERERKRKEEEETRERERRRREEEEKGAREAYGALEGTLVPTSLELVRLAEASVAFAACDLLVAACRRKSGEERPRLVAALVAAVRAAADDEPPAREAKLRAALHLTALLANEDAPSRETLAASALPAALVVLLRSWVEKEKEKREAEREKKELEGERGPPPPWLAPLLLVLDVLAQHPPSCRPPNAPASPEEGEEAPVRERYLPEAEAGDTLELLAEALRQRATSDHGALQAALQLLARLTRTPALAARFARMGGVPALLSLPAAARFPGYVVLVGVLLRHAAEDPATLQQAMEAQVRTAMSSGAAAGGLSRAGAGSGGVPTQPRALLTALAPVVGREPRTFAAAVASQCDLDESSPARTLLRLRPAAAAAAAAPAAGRASLGTSATPVKGAAAAAGPFKGAGGVGAVTAALLDAVMLGAGHHEAALQAALLRERQSHAKWKGKGKEGEHVEEKDGGRPPPHDAAVSPAAALQYVADFVSSYPACAAAVLKHHAPSSYKPVSPSDPKPGETALAFILREVLPYPAEAPGQQSEESRLRVVAASSLILALCGRPGDVRRKTVCEMVAALTASAGEAAAPGGAGVGALLALVDAVQAVLTAGREPGSAGGGSPYQYNADVARIMLEQGALAALTAALKALDVKHPGAPAVANALLKPLNLLTYAASHQRPGPAGEKSPKQPAQAGGQQPAAAAATAASAAARGDAASGPAATGATGATAGTPPAVTPRPAAAGEGGVAAVQVEEGAAGPEEHTHIADQMDESTDEPTAPRLAGRRRATDADEDGDGDGSGDDDDEESDREEEGERHGEGEEEEEEEEEEGEGGRPRGAGGDEHDTSSSSDEEDEEEGAGLDVNAVVDEIVNAAGGGAHGGGRRGRRRRGAEEEDEDDEEDGAGEGDEGDEGGPDLLHEAVPAVAGGQAAAFGMGGEEDEEDEEGDEDEGGDEEEEPEDAEGGDGGAGEDGVPHELGPGEGGPDDMDWGEGHGGVHVLNGGMPGQPPSWVQDLLATFGRPRGARGGPQAIPVRIGGQAGARAMLGPSGERILMAPGPGAAPGGRRAGEHPLLQRPDPTGAAAGAAGETREVRVETRIGGHDVAIQIVESVAGRGGGGRGGQGGRGRAGRPGEREGGLQLFGEGLLFGGGGAAGVQLGALEAALSERIAALEAGAGGPPRFSFIHDAAQSVFHALGIAPAPPAGSSAAAAAGGRVAAPGRWSDDGQRTSAAAASFATSAEPIVVAAARQATREREAASRKAAEGEAAAAAAAAAAAPPAPAPMEEGTKEAAPAPAAEAAAPAAPAVPAEAVAPVAPEAPLEPMAAEPTTSAPVAPEAPVEPLEAEPTGPGAPAAPAAPAEAAPSAPAEPAPAPAQPPAEAPAAAAAEPAAPAAPAEVAAAEPAQPTTAAAAGGSGPAAPADFGIDPTFLAALPEELRAEVLATHIQQIAGASAAAGEGGSGISPEFLAALPPEIQAEVLEQERALRRSQQRARERESQRAAAAAASVQEMDNASFLATLEGALREEVLLTSDDVFLASLPAELAAEAHLLRQRALQHTRAPPPPRPAHPAAPAAAAARESVPGRAGRPSAPAAAAPAAAAAEKESGEAVVDEGTVASLVRLLFVGQAVGKGTLQRVLLNLCGAPPTRAYALEALLDLVLADEEPGPRALPAPLPDRLFGSPLPSRPAPGPSASPAAAARAAVAASAASAASAGGPSGAVPGLVSRRALETLTQLASKSQRVALYLAGDPAQAPAPARPDAAAPGPSSGAAAARVAFAHGPYPLGRLVALLGTPLYARSPSHLEQLVALLSVVLQTISRLRTAHQARLASAQAEAKAASSATAAAEAALQEATTAEAAAEGEEARAAARKRREEAEAAAAAARKAEEEAAVRMSEEESRGRVLAGRSMGPGDIGALANVLVRDECTEGAFTRCTTVFALLAELPANRAPLLRQMLSVADTLGRSAAAALAGPREAPAPAGPAAAPVSTELKLLRVLRITSALLSRAAAGPGPQRAAEGDEGGLTEVVESWGACVARMEPLWEALHAALTALTERAHAAAGGQQAGQVNELTGPSGPALARLLPAIEAFFVVNRPPPASAAAAHAAHAHAHGAEGQPATPAPGGAYTRFTEGHRRLLNGFVRQQPALLEGSLAALVRPGSRVLDFDNKRAWFRAQLRRQLHASDGQHYAPLRIHVRRAQVFEDSYHQLRMRTGEEMKGRLQVQFVGEEGIDAGGVAREWYLILSREMFNANYALFRQSALNNRTFQPNPMSYVNPDHLSYLRFIGRIIGKAVLDGQLLDAYFTRSFYKHMLGVAVSYHDMEAMDPEFYKSLKWITENDITGVLESTMSAEVDEFGQIRVVDLVPNGRHVPVTEANKHEYIRAICDLKMTTAIRQQINAFLDGFHELVPPHLIAVFNELELELLISGLPDVDVDDLRANTEYTGFSATSDSIAWFWRAVGELDREERARLLQFVTGTSKVPLDGFKNLQGIGGVQRFQIHRAYGSPDRLPSAHTCFNQLDLPEYPSFEHLRERLRMAIREGSEGFGFG